MSTNISVSPEIAPLLVQWP